MKILIVEDDLFNRTILADILAPYGTCDVAEDGLQAVEAFERSLAQGKPYQLITLDIVMPGMDGRAVLRRMRSLEEQAGIAAPQAAKVIMVTSMGDADNILESFDARCDSYLTKPISQEPLIERLKFLGLLP